MSAQTAAMAAAERQLAAWEGRGYPERTIALMAGVPHGAGRKEILERIAAAHARWTRRPQPHGSPRAQR